MNKKDRRRIQECIERLDVLLTQERLDLEDRFKIKGVRNLLRVSAAPKRKSHLHY